MSKPRHALPTVLILGLPNVGKSTLFNRLIGKRRHIVFDEPGVTRDWLEGECNKGTQPFRLIDTAGFEPGSIWEHPEIQKVLRVILREADLALYVVDGRQDVNPRDREAIRDLRREGIPLFLVVNKMDNLKDETAHLVFSELGISPLYAVSSEHGLGTSSLISDIEDFFEEGRDREGAVPLLSAPPLSPRSRGGAMHSEGALPPPDRDRVIKLAIVGRPNVGKSTLLNALARMERMVVSPEPGTTRDAVELPISVAGRNYLLVDTAGIRRPGKRETRVERASVSQSRESIESADVVLWLLDAAEGVAEGDKRVLGEIMAVKKPFIAVFNKVDLAKAAHRASSRSPFDKTFRDLFHHSCRGIAYAPLFFISAKMRQGFTGLFRAVDELHKESETRVSTGEANRVLRELIEEYPPPSQRGHRVRIYYATQVKTRPPTFVFFANLPQYIHFSYGRFLENALRERLPFKHIPIQIFMKAREGRGA